MNSWRFSSESSRWPGGTKKSSCPHGTFLSGFTKQALQAFQQG